MIIDAWIQPPFPAFLQNPMFTSITRWRDFDPRIFSGPAPLEFTLQALDQAKVDRALINAWWGPQGPMISNDEVASMVRSYPDRLVGVAAVNLLKPREAIKELRRCVRQLGFRALRVLPWLWNLPPNDRRYYPLYSECVELGIPFCLQVGHTGPMCPSEPGRPIPYLDEVALDFPELTIIGGHVGFPWTNEMISLATKYPNVFIDTSAYKIRRYPRELIDYMRGHGMKKVLFGSNFPMISPAECLDGLEEQELSEECKKLFLGQNAVRVFGLS